jgi:hypothetical protein
MVRLKVKLALDVQADLNIGAVSPIIALDI